MSKSKTTFWELPRIEINRRNRPAQITFDTWNTDMRLSSDAFDRLGKFLVSYRKANLGRKKREGYCMSPSSGEFGVRPEHAEEMAARLLCHLKR